MPVCARSFCRVPLPTTGQAGEPNHRKPRFRTACSLPPRVRHRPMNRQVFSSARYFEGGLPPSPAESTGTGCKCRSSHLIGESRRFPSTRGQRPRCEVLISQGDREIGSRASPDFGFRVAACKSNALCSPQRKYFLFRSSEPKNAFAPSQYSRSSDLPVKVSIARGGLHPLRKLLRFRLQFGSPR